MNFIEKQVLPRVAAIIWLPGVAGDTVPALGRLATGALASIVSVATFNAKGYVYDGVRELSGARTLVPNVYCSFFSILNPDAAQSAITEMYKKHESLLTKVVARGYFQNSFERSIQPEQSRFKQIVMSRLLLAGYAMTATITKVIDLAIGVLAAAASFVTFGYFEKVNTFAVRQLKSFDFVALPFVIASAMVDPSKTLTREILFPTAF
jgi:hypothetical protein